MALDWSDLDLGSGKITWGPPFELDTERPLSEQEDFLDEDILQIEFPNKVVVDLGWYGGDFAVYVIQAGDWGSPVKEYRFRDPELIYSRLQNAIHVALTCSA